MLLEHAWLCYAKIRSNSIMRAEFTRANQPAHHGVLGVWESRSSIIPAHTCVVFSYTPARSTLNHHPQTQREQGVGSHLRHGIMSVRRRTTRTRNQIRDVAIMLRPCEKVLLRLLFSSASAAVLQPYAASCMQHTRPRICSDTNAVFAVCSLLSSLLLHPTA